MFIFASQGCAVTVGVPFCRLPKIGQSIQAKANEKTGKNSDLVIKEIWN
jgi:hypothetical protein